MSEEPIDEISKKFEELGKQAMEADERRKIRQSQVGIPPETDNQELVDVSGKKKDAKQFTMKMKKSGVKTVFKKSREGDFKAQRLIDANGNVKEID